MENLRNIKNLMGGDTNSLYAAQQEKSQKLQRKWKKTGLLENLKNPSEQSNMAVLLENQAIQLLKESTTTGTTTGSEEWSGVALPLVRKVFGELAAKEFVSVQPLNLPSGLVFFLEFKYSNTKAPYTSGGSVYGDLTSSVQPTGGFYGAGRYSYSISPLTHSAVAFTTASVSWSDINYDSELSSSMAAGHLKKITMASSSISSSYDRLAVRSFDVSGSALKAYYPQFTKTTANGSHISFIVSGSVVNGNYKVTYSEQPVSYDRGDFEYQGQGNFSIPEIDLELKSEPIVAKTRKLKASWTPEIAQDLVAYHNVDAEAELTNILSEHISMEIDLEILDMLLNKANVVDYWSAKPGFEYTAGGTWTQNTYYVVGNKSQWFQTIGIKMQKISNLIHAKTMRGGANFAVCSPTVATILESLDGFTAKTTGNEMNFAMGTQQVGTINNRIQIYKNPYMKENVILMGYRGNNFLETGAVFAPYVPLIMTPLIYDPTTLVPRKGVMTRYGKKVFRPEFYGALIINGVDTI